MLPGFEVRAARESFLLPDEGLTSAKKTENSNLFCGPGDRGDKSSPSLF